MSSAAEVNKTKAKLTDNRLLFKIAKQKYLLILLFPALIWLIAFCYMPMLGLCMAFVNYTPNGSSFWSALFSSEFVGLKWIKFFLFQSGDFYNVMRNTLATSLLTLMMSIPAPIILALTLNEVRHKLFKSVVQTVSYLPHFISWVVVSNIFLTLLSANGVVNYVLSSIGIAKEPILFFKSGTGFWWIVAIANTWKGMGYTAIIYLAAISGVSPELYEAATIDGATRMQQIWHVTLPTIRDTIVIMLILAVAGILNAGFEQQLLMSNPAIMDYANVIDLYSYNYGIQQGMYSYGAAIGLFKGVISFTLLVIVNQISRRMDSAHIM